MCCMLPGHCELESLAQQPDFLLRNYRIITGDSQSPPSRCLWAHQARSLAPCQRLPQARGLLLLLLLLLFPVRTNTHTTTTKTHKGISSEQPWHVTYTAVFAFSVPIEVSEVSVFTQSFITSFVISCNLLSSVIPQTQIY